MSILMMTVIYGAVFLTAERTTGALRRQATVPLSRLDIVTGKLLGRLLIALVQALLLLAAGKYLYGVFWGRSAAGLALVVVAFAACAAACGLLFGAVFRTPEQAGAVGWIAPLLMAALGGCWWPLEVVPRWLQLAGHISPAAWSMDALHRLSSFGEGLGAVWLPSMVLFAYAALFTLLAARYLRWE